MTELVFICCGLLLQAQEQIYKYCTTFFEKCAWELFGDLCTCDALT